jgi:hypothetical protein
MVWQARSGEAWQGVARCGKVSLGMAGMAITCNYVLPVRQELRPVEAPTPGQLAARCASMKREPLAQSGSTCASFSAKAQVKKCVAHVRGG